MSTSYFIKSKEWSLRNNPADIGTGKKKVLTRTWTNRFDYFAVGVTILAAFWQMLFYYTTVLAYSASRRSGLNLGITSAIWSFIPFFVAIIDRIVYGTGVRPY